MSKSEKQILMDKVFENGIGSLNDHELLRLILSYAQKSQTAETADTLMNNFIGIRSIVDADTRILVNKFGISENSAVLLKMICALSQESSLGKNSITYLKTSGDAKEFFRKNFIGASQEYFTVVAVDDNFKKTDIFRSSSGSDLSVQTSSREIVKFAVKSNCSRLFISHNHLNENTSPSEDDIISTKRIISLLEALGITVIDHIIAGRNSAESMRENPSLDIFDNVPAFDYKFRGRL